MATPQPKSWFVRFLQRRPPRGDGCSTRPVRSLADGGYEAVGMRQVAADAGVSADPRILIFSSKDHLLVDVLVDLVGQTTAVLLESTAPRPIAADSVWLRMLWLAVRNVEKAPNLYVRNVRALYISGHTRGRVRARQWNHRRAHGSISRWARARSATAPVIGAHPRGGAVREHGRTRHRRSRARRHRRRARAAVRTLLKRQ